MDGLTVIFVAFLIGFLLGSAVVSWRFRRYSFYRGYFRQKQIGRGKDPDVVMREEFGD